MNKIKKVLNGDNTSKGSIVEIMFGKDPLKAKIIAVHGKWYFSIWMIVLHLKMLDARPGFIIKFLKRSLIVNLFKTQAFDCQSAVFDR
jgi:hypothetical protein